MSEPIARHIVCHSCGYCLAGLPETGACPECATPCSASLARFEFLKNNTEALRKVSSGLQTTYFGYVLLATSAGIFIVDSLFNGFMPRELRITIAFIGFIALCAAALSLPAGLFKLARFSNIQHDPEQSHFHAKLLHTGLLGCLLSFIAVLPLALLLPSLLLLIIFFIGMPCSITLIVFGTANCASYIASQVGIRNLRRASIAVCSIASPVAAIMIASSIAIWLGSSSKLGTVLGINGGQWQDIFIIAVAAILLIHAVFVLYFYHKLKARLDILTP